ncbi:MAG: ATP-binding protein [Planctomycetaceae bacterium]|jgi:ABC-type cobalamin/Fe3+-siderophores transport system ATPase subunit|nr:ATP-binding protein [Planctomycetaceae bacterium]
MFNPFSTKFWSPGVIPFQFTQPGETMDTLLQKSQLHSICQIVGPHGSGKSTLLLGLLNRWKENGENVRYLSFNDQHRCLPRDLTFQEDQILFADGTEWLPFGDSFRLLARSERLIFITHRPIWFIPILYRTKPQFSVFIQLVRQMRPNMPDESVLQTVFDRSGGNFRNAFFELYDLWEKESER